MLQKQHGNDQNRYFQRKTIVRCAF